MAEEIVEDLPPKEILIATDSSDDSELTSSDAYSDSDSEEAVDESLASTIIQEIEDGSYVCLVCTCEIDRQSKIWSCDECYRVYDLDCIKDWAVRGSSTTSNKQWRCPACNFNHSKLPKTSTCWCGRVKNPGPDSLIPFSCGNPCGTTYPSCVHQCSSHCHPGKHPECGALGPVMKCHCGKHEQQLPCLATPYEAGWGCDTPCDVTVCPLGHKCASDTCHAGFCGPCAQPLEVACFCGKHTVQKPCAEVRPERCHRGAEEFIGAAACQDTLVQYFDCNVHFAEKRCQPLPARAPHCEFAPDVVDSCYCGKTASGAIARERCTDPMPECDEVCGKALPCGCRCRTKCHPGPCVCFSILDTACVCGQTSCLVPCKALQQGFAPRCRHKCNALLSCKKHWHREECCEYEQAALRRERENRRLSRKRAQVNFDHQIDTMEAIHICTRTCNQTRSCGKHTCDAMCHRGPCGPCLESSSEDLVCHCGKTVVAAPVRCGTVIDCREQCVRAKACGHEQEVHECHGDDADCPKCLTKVARMCNCGAKEIANVPCFVESASCGKLCAHAKECGHACNRACSRDCVEGRHSPLVSCQSFCRKIKNSCPHMCEQKCHVGKKTPCDLRKCEASVVVTCGCGRISKSVACGASVSNNSRIGTLLECDDICALNKREEELRSLFNLSSKQSSTAYPAEALKVFRVQTKWCSRYESVMRDFISDHMDCVAAEIPAKKTVHLPPMTKPQRKFIHDLAEAYRLYSESQDKEPKRSVFLVITPATVLPSQTLAQAVEAEDVLAKKKELLESLDTAEAQSSLSNGILIQDVFFGISKDDVDKNVTGILESKPHIEFKPVSWVKDSTFVFHADYFSEMTKEKEDELYMLTKTFKKVLRENYVAFDCKMCFVDSETAQVIKIDNARKEKPAEDKPAEPQTANAFDALGDAEV